MRRVCMVLILTCMIVGEALPAMAGSSRSDFLTSQIMTRRRLENGSYLRPKTSNLEVKAEAYSKVEEATCEPTPASTTDTDTLVAGSETPTSTDGGMEYASNGNSAPAMDGSAVVDVAKGAMNSPPSGTKWDHFHELSAYAGYYHGFDSGTNGVWTMAEYIRWYTHRREIENFGFGVTAKTDYGWGKNEGVRWGSVSVGPNLDYYRELALDQYLLLKLRPLYRFGLNGSRSGFAPGGYLEYDIVLGKKDTFIATFDATYFKDDSYFGINLMFEHRLNKDIKLKAGLGLTLWDLSEVGFGPVAAIKLYDRFVLSASLNVLNGGTFGCFVGYELNTDLRAIDAKIRERSVSMKDAGTGGSAPMPEEDNMQLTAAGGEYINLPGATGEIRISNEPLSTEVSR